MIVMVLVGIAALLGPLIVARQVRKLWSNEAPRLAMIWSGLAALLWAMGVWGFFIEPELLFVRQVSVQSAQWSGPPLRVGVISDIHVGGPHVSVARVGRLVQQMNDEHPDIVLLLGDYTGGTTPPTVIRGIAALSGLKSPFGSVGVLGNHDSGRELANKRDLAKAGIPVVDNAAARIERPDGTAFWVAGLADMTSHLKRPSIETALQTVPPGAPVILITHFPDPFETAPERIALTLAGHSHCGQVRLPIVGRIISSSPGARRWPCGLYEVGGRQLYVTGGVGESILPVRFGAPPEIAVITLSTLASGAPGH